MKSSPTISTWPNIDDELLLVSIADYTASMFLICQQYKRNKKMVHKLLTNFDKMPLMLTNWPALHTWLTILYTSIQVAHAGPSRQSPKCNVTLPDFRIPSVQYRIYFWRSGVWMPYSVLHLTATCCSVVISQSKLLIQCWILIQRSGRAEWYNATLSTLLLALTSRSGFTTRSMAANIWWFVSCHHGIAGLSCHQSISWKWRVCRNHTCNFIYNLSTTFAT